jgi:hypothetical protein
MIPKQVIENKLKAQNGKCANKPDSNIPNIQGYECPMWKLYDGLFDLSGYKHDSIIDLEFGGLYDENNLQLLCVCCHSVKQQKKPKFLDF